MIHSKSLNQQGFTFIELILAVAMIGICITAIFTLQSNLLTSVAERADVIRRILYTKNLLYEYMLDLNPETISKAQTKKVDDPAMQVVLQAKPVPATSKLRQFQHVYMVSGNATWEFNGVRYDQTLMTFAIMPPEKKEEKK